MMFFNSKLLGTFIFFVTVLEISHAAKPWWLLPQNDPHAIQDKIHTKRKKFYISGGGGLNLSSNYTDTYGIQGAIGYYLSEDMAIEIQGGTFVHSIGEDTDTLLGIGSATSIVPFIRRFKFTAFPTFIWSPFYGKLNTFDAITYLDWYFGLGVGFIQLENNRKGFDKAQKVLEENQAKIQANDVNNLVTLKRDELLDFESTNAYGVNLKTGVKVHLSKRFKLDLFYNATIYQDDDSSGDSKSIYASHDVYLVGSLFF